MKVSKLEERKRTLNSVWSFWKMLTKSSWHFTRENCLLKRSTLQMLYITICEMVSRKSTKSDLLYIFIQCSEPWLKVKISFQTLWLCLSWLLYFEFLAIFWLWPRGMFSVYSLLSLIFCSVYVPETKQSSDASVTVDVISKLTQYQVG